MELTILFLLLTSHWFCDFVLQTHKEAINKSKSMYWLTSHTLTYSMGMFIILGAYTMLFNKGQMVAVFLFLPITFVAHTVTDYFTSRLNTKLWNKGDSHNFFVSVGFDQLLHYVQLILTYKLLFA